MFRVVGRVGILDDVRFGRKDGFEVKREGDGMEGGLVEERKSEVTKAELLHCCCGWS